MAEAENSEYELTWLQDFDDDALVVERVDSFVDFGVLASADLLDDLVVVLGPEREYGLRIVDGYTYWNLTSKLS